jgi:hypothetical protein
MCVNESSFVSSCTFSRLCIVPAKTCILRYLELIFNFQRGVCMCIGRAKLTYLTTYIFLRVAHQLIYPS